MRALIGLDLTAACEAGLLLLKRLKFDAPELKFVNVVEPILPDGGFPELAASNPMAMILDDLQKAGKELLAKKQAEFPGSTTELMFGGAAYCLLQAAGEFSADLVIVGSQQKSLIESMFVGSVTKALTLQAKQSVLIGKHAPKSEDGLVVVFAHDMSEYSDKALDHFVALGPKGVSRIVLLTADTTDPSIIAVVERTDPGMAGETHSVIESRLENRHQEIVGRLKRICPRVDSVVSEGQPNDVINETMASSNADLLVLGAHGHNFLERLVIGSVALHQVVREPHNVLIVRA